MDERERLIEELDWCIENGTIGPRSMKAFIAARATLAPAQPIYPEWISEHELAKLLPGPYYMDPPDGGSVTLLEQLQRMAHDAKRYRCLRNCYSRDERMDVVDQWDGAMDESLDAAILKDAAPSPTKEQTPASSVASKEEEFAHLKRCSEASRQPQRYEEDPPDLHSRMGDVD